MLVQLDNRRITNNLTRRRSQLIALVFLRLEQEVQFFQRFSVRLGEENINENDLETEPHHVHDQVLPVDIFKTNGVDKGACTVSVVSPKSMNWNKRQ